MNKFIIIEFHQSLQSNFTVSGNFTPGVATVLYSKHVNVGILVASQTVARQIVARQTVTRQTVAGQTVAIQAIAS